MEEKQELANSLAAELQYASANYYRGEPSMSDEEYDKKYRKLRRLNPKHPFLSVVGTPDNDGVKVRHTIKMGSLSNVNNAQELKKWAKSRKFTSRGTEFVIDKFHASQKMDGSSIELVYDRGLFTQAITRGDGLVGEDVTKNLLIAAVKGNAFPLSVDNGITSIRAEAYIEIDVWEQQELFANTANPRNSAAGTVRRTDGEGAEFIYVAAFDVITEERLQTYNQLFNYLEHEGFDTPAHMCGTLDEVVKFSKQEESHRDSLPYEIDGIVVRVNDISACGKMGERENRPRGQTAFKFKPRGAETVIRDVVWQVGKDGTITPVAKVAPVGVGGVTIRSVSLCNPDEIKRLGVAINDTVSVVRAGDVVPKITGLVRKGEKRKKIRLPLLCPKCRSDDVIKDGARLYCRNADCAEQMFQRIMNWIKKRNILYLGEETVHAAYEAGTISCIADIYRAEVEDLEGLEVGNGVLGAKQAERICSEVRKSTKTTLPEFLGSLSIKGMGRSVAKKICEAKNISSLDEFMQLSVSDITRIPGLGSTSARVIVNSRNRFKDTIRRVAEYVEWDTDEASTGVLAGKKVCFTGDGGIKRSKLQKMVEEHGGESKSSVTKDLDYLVIADPDSQTSKAKKARSQDNTELITVEAFLDLVGWDGEI